MMPVIKKQEKSGNFFHLGIASFITLDLAKFRKHLPKCDNPIFKVYFVQQTDYAVSLARDHILVDLLKGHPILAELVQSWCNCKVERFLRMVIVIDFAFSRVKQRKQLIQSFFIDLLSFWLSQTSLEKNKQPSHHLISQVPLFLQ